MSDFDIRNIHPKQFIIADGSEISVYEAGEGKVNNERVPVFVALHDIGGNATSWNRLFENKLMQNTMKRALWLFFELPGQNDGASDLQVPFPSLDVIAEAIKDILHQMRVRLIIGIGEGAGANILTRFALLYPQPCLGLVAISPTSTDAGLKELIFSPHNQKNLEEYLIKYKYGNRDHHYTDAMKVFMTQFGNKNPKNIISFLTAFEHRTAIQKELIKLKVPTLIATGANSYYLHTTDHFFEACAPKFTEYIKLKDCADPLTENPDAVARGVILFCQGLGIFSSFDLPPAELPESLSLEEPNSFSARSSSNLVLKKSKKNARTEQEETARTHFQHKLMRSLRDSGRLVVKEADLLYHEITVDTNAGPIDLYIAGDLSRKDKYPVFFTVHDIGRNAHTWDFMLTSSLALECFKRSIWIHFEIPGQAADADDYTKKFPTLDELAEAIYTVLTKLQISLIIAIGDGVGANIFFRFCVKYPEKVLGFVALHVVPKTSGIIEWWQEQRISGEMEHGALGIKAINFLVNYKFGSHVKEPLAQPLIEAFKHELRAMNPKNVEQLILAYKNRTEIIPLIKRKFHTDLFLIVPQYSSNVVNSAKIFDFANPQKTQCMKMRNCADAILQLPDHTLHTILLYAQGLGVLVSLVLNQHHPHHDFLLEAHHLRLTDFDIQDME